MVVSSVGYLDSQDEIDVVNTMDVFVRSFAVGDKLTPEEPKANETILDDGSKFTRVSPTKISIEKDGVITNISSNCNIDEVGIFTKTKEWECKSKGKHYYLQQSNKKLIIVHDNICVNNPITYDNFEIVGNSMVFKAQTKYYERCILYPINETLNHTQIDDFTVRTTFNGPLDPTIDFFNATGGDGHTSEADASWSTTRTTTNAQDWEQCSSENIKVYSIRQGGGGL